jgi:hypothetical protein
VHQGSAVTVHRGRVVSVNATNTCVNFAFRLRISIPWHYKQERAGPATVSITLASLQQQSLLTDWDAVVMPERVHIHAYSDSHSWIVSAAFMAAAHPSQSQQG